MKRRTRGRSIGAVVAAGVAALMLVVPAAHADVTRTGNEPWYRNVPPAVEHRAQALFDQAVEKHQQLLRGDAKELYEQALALWDNPDIQWNLTLVLEDLGQYLRAHQQLEGALRWGAALGDERLLQVHDQMRVLESQRLARLEVSTDEPEAEIKLDGGPWFRGAGSRRTLVLPGEHYVAASKPGYFPVTRSVSVVAGQQARLALPMDVDRLVKTRRWSVRAPWGMVASGLAVAVGGVALEWRAFTHRGAAADALSAGCGESICPSSSVPNIYHRAQTEDRLASAAFGVGGAAIAVGLILALLNQPRERRTEPRAPARIEVTPIVSPDRGGLSALLRF
ncbi:MAG TPA: hypothetical protein VFK02_10145 [Kofleriaceae bacterium]|nr:hypothetical protein [Kofleriaceae bacterium]